MCVRPALVEALADGVSPHRSGTPAEAPYHVDVSQRIGSARLAIDPGAHDRNPTGHRGAQA
jgi:hypothetical protein